MKILIISTGRSGSTSLLRGLNKSINNSISKFEPFHPDFNNLNFNQHLNTIQTLNETYIEKCLIHDPVQHKHIILSSFQGVYKFIDHDNEIFFGKEMNVAFYKTYVKNFDRIILLDRKDLIKTSLSWAQITKSNKIFDKYVPEENIDNTRELRLTKKRHKQLKRLSKYLNLDIVWYEDLFSGSKNYIKYFLEKHNIEVDNFEILYEHLNPKHKYTLNL